MSALSIPRPSALFRSLLPAGVAAFEVDPRDFPAASLWAAERPFVEKGIEHRRSEFAAGRACARAALAELGVEAAPILVGEGRSPSWPESIVGSITHTANYCAAALAQGESCAAIGIDAEIVGRMGESEAGIILNEDETDWIDSHEPQARQNLWALVFSAKEALYKAQFPLTRTRLYFHDVSVTVLRENGSFRVVLHDSAAAAANVLGGREFEGRHRFHEDLVLSALAIPD